MQIIFIFTQFLRFDFGFILALCFSKFYPKVKVETQFFRLHSLPYFEAAGMKRLTVGMGLHKASAPPHRQMVHPDSKVILVQGNTKNLKN